MYAFSISSKINYLSTHNTTFTIVPAYSHLNNYFSGLELEYSECKVAGNSLIIKDIVAIGNVMSQQGKVIG